MSFINPGVLLMGAAAAGALVWLWRLAASHHQTRVASLIPFEQLLRRTATRRRRLVTNRLFWLQLAALLMLACALAGPMVSLPAGKRVLVLIDTSASMSAMSRGSPAFERAKSAVLGRLMRKAPNDMWLVVATAPAAPLLPQPTADGGALRRAIEALHPTQLSGNLATAARLGGALLGGAPEAVLVATDEPAPAALPPGVVFLSVGRPAPNVAIVGLDAQGPFCAPTDARVFVTVQNFSSQQADVTVTARVAGRQAARVPATLEPGARLAVPVTLPADATGLAAFSLEGRHEDALAADNTAWVDVSRHAALPLTLELSDGPLAHTLTRWLGACQALHLTDAPPDGPFLLVTDHESAHMARASGGVRFIAPRTPAPRPSYWVVEAQHPIGAYLDPVAAMTVPLTSVAEAGRRGTPVISALLDGQRLPVVQVLEPEGRRFAELMFNPAGYEQTTPVVLAVFNSVRWAMGSRGAATVGEPALFDGLAQGEVRLTRPDGATDVIRHEQGTVRYEATMVSGVYEARQGRLAQLAPVNFLDPVESNLLSRVSTWQETRLSDVARSRPGTRVPLERWLLLAALALLAVEWWWYAQRSRAAARR